MSLQKSAIFFVVMKTHGHHMQASKKVCLFRFYSYDLKIKVSEGAIWITLERLAYFFRSYTSAKTDPKSVLCVRVSVFLLATVIATRVSGL